MEEKLLQQTNIPNLKRIVLYGPESTGKTTLAKALAEHFDTVWVPEYARPYLEAKMAVSGEICALDDILPIAIGQVMLENDLALQARQNLLICDTDILTTHAYSLAFYSQSPAALVEALPHQQVDLYLLTDIDVPWEADAIRDRPGVRQVMLDLFQQQLKQFNRPFLKVTGSIEERMHAAVLAIEAIRKKY